MRVIYSFFIYGYYLTISIASIVNVKARKWLSGRRNLMDQLTTKLENEKNIVWIHCASVGEFEQGRPIMENLKRNNKETKLLLTFFSPSGYELRKDYKGADFVFYLPLDTAINAKKFIQIVNPKAAIIVKYDFWYNLFNELKKNNIPYFLVSCKFRPEQYFFKVYGKWFANQLADVTHIFVQDEQSAALLNTIGVTHVSIVGDTRVDRVVEISRNTEHITIAKQFSTNSKVIIAGSTWPADEDMLATFINQQSGRYADLKFIIVPHEINNNSIDSLTRSITQVRTVRFSQANATVMEHARVLIVDNVGLLSRLYAYGQIAYIGGGFGKGIHNILEAAVFGLPIIFGPNYHKFKEATDLLALGAARNVTHQQGLAHALSELLNNSTAHENAKKACFAYIEMNKGATLKITAVINDYIK